MYNLLLEKYTHLSMISRMKELTLDEIDLLLETLKFGIPAVDAGSASYEQRRDKVNRMQALMSKLREIRRDIKSRNT